MAAGKLNKRVEVLAATTAEDTHGGEVTSWSSTRLTLWARIEFLGESEVLRRNRVTGQANVRVTVRHGAAVQGDERLRFNSRTFAIISVINADQGNEFEVILAKEVKDT